MPQLYEVALYILLLFRLLYYIYTLYTGFLYTCSVKCLKEHYIYFINMPFYFSGVFKRVTTPGSPPPLQTPAPGMPWNQSQGLDGPESAREMIKCFCFKIV